MERAFVLLVLVFVVVVSLWLVLLLFGGKGGDGACVANSSRIVMGGCSCTTCAILFGLVHHLCARVCVCLHVFSLPVCCRHLAVASAA